MTAALEPCPNPECEWSDPGPEYRGMLTWVACQACDTRSAPVEVESDSSDDWTAATAEARRLWGLLPRAPRWTSEPPTPGTVRTLPLNDAIAEYMRAFGLDVKRVEIVDHPRGGNYAEVYISQTGFVVIPFVPQFPAERSDRP